MARLTLEIEEEYPFFLFGISAATSDYRVCWSLNKALGIALKREKPILLFRRDHDHSEHSYYQYHSETQFAAYRLIQNRSGNSVFILDLPKVDYLLLIDQTPAIQPDDLVKKLREIRQILMVQLIDIETLKNKQNLLLTT
jgi:hypothetical protein